jgi:hypothetical protein
MCLTLRTVALVVRRSNGRGDWYASEASVVFLSLDLNSGVATIVERSGGHGDWHATEASVASPSTDALARAPELEPNGRSSNRNTTEVEYSHS